MVSGTKGCTLNNLNIMPCGQKKYKQTSNFEFRISNIEVFYFIIRNSLFDIRYSKKTFNCQKISQNLWGRVLMPPLAHLVPPLCGGTNHHRLCGFGILISSHRRAVGRDEVFPNLRFILIGNRNICILGV